MCSKIFKILILLGSLSLSSCTGSSVSPGITQSQQVIVITSSTDNLVAGGVSIQFSATISTTSGQVLSDVNFVWNSDDGSIVHVDQNGLATGIKVGVTQLTATSGTVTGRIRVGIVSPNPGASNITFSGKAEYEDKLFNETTFTSSITPNPIRNALVEILAIDGFQIISTGPTDTHGNFSIPADNSQNRGGVYVRVLSKSHPGDLSKIEILNNPTDGALYSFASAGHDDSGSNPFLVNDNLLAKTSGSGGAFNLLDVFMAAGEFLRQSGPCPGSNAGCTLPLLKGYWEQGSSEGTHYVSPQNEIFVLGGGQGDADEYDDSVAIHEFGHFALQQFSGDDSPGGPHGLFENDQDIRLSWSEGWANFFSSAVRGTPIYIDEAAGGIFTFDLERYSLGPNDLDSLARYTTSEFAVAGVMWDLLDPPDLSENDPITLPLGFTDIWQTAMSFPSFSPATMETFWLQFNTNPATTSFAPGLQTLMTGRQIELLADVGPAPTLTDVSSLHFTIYKDGGSPENDEDIIPFTVNNGNTYTITTMNLTNGADTLLTINEPGVAERGQNDNTSGLTFFNCSSNCPPNGRTDLASSVSFPWNSGDGVQLNAHVKRSANAPPSSGQFGSYDIQLTISP